MYRKLWLDFLICDKVLGKTFEGIQRYHTLHFVLVNVEDVLIGDCEKSLLDPLIFINLLDLTTEENWLILQKLYNIGHFCNASMIVVH